MEIKRDDPARRKSFRARHKCENPGPKWKARYWSCKMWSKKSVTNVTKGSELSEDELLDLLDESEAKRPGPKSAAQTPQKNPKRKRVPLKTNLAVEEREENNIFRKVINAAKEKVSKHNEKHPSKKILGSPRKFRRGAGAFQVLIDLE